MIEDCENCCALERDLERAEAELTNMKETAHMALDDRAELIESLAYAEEDRYDMAVALGEAEDKLAEIRALCDSDWLAVDIADILGVLDKTE